MRSGFMPCRIYSNPRPSSPRRSSSGISKFSKNSSLESTGLRPIFSISCTAIFQRRGACEQENLLGDLCGRDPDFLAVDDIFVALEHRTRLELRGVEAGVGLGDGKARLLLARDDARQHAPALLLGAKHDDGIEPEHVHMNC